MGRRLRVLVLAAVASSMLVGTGVRAVATHDPLKATQLVGSLNYPSMFTFAADGRIFYSELFTGKIGLYDPATGSNSTYHTVPGVCQTAGAQGLFGIALHPEFATNKTVFVHANRGANCDNELLKIVDRGEPVVLWTVPSGEHNGGRLKFGTDGKLYWSGGDGDQPSSATDTGDRRGKIWRFDVDGPELNPTMVAIGVRNVFGFDFDASNLWFSDNGDACNEEVNLIQAPGSVVEGQADNYGWGPNATCDGQSPQNSNQDGADPVMPAWYYATAQGATGLAFCKSCGLGAALEGRLLYFLFDNKELHALTLDGARTGVSSSEAVFTHPHNGKPHSLERAPNGRLYYSTDTAIYELAATTAPPTGGSTFRPLADARVNANNPSTNYGTESILKAKGGSAPNNSYLKFDVRGLGGMVASTKLRLKVTDGSAHGGSIRPVVNTTWTEGGITYNNAPAISSTVLASAAAVSTGQTVEFDLGSAVTGNGIYSFALTSTDSSDPVSYSSREGANPPELLITVSGTVTTSTLGTATSTTTASGGTCAATGNATVTAPGEVTGSGVFGATGDCAVVRGGGGADSITVGSHSGTTKVVAGAGADKICARNGSSDVVKGGDGSDTALVDSGDTLESASVVATLDCGGSATTTTLGATTTTTTAAGGTCTATGNATVTASGEVTGSGVFGATGDCAVVRGGGGADSITVGSHSGTTKVVAGAGADKICARNGSSDVVKGGDGSDTALVDSSDTLESASVVTTLDCGA